MNAIEKFKWIKETGCFIRSFSYSDIHDPAYDPEITFSLYKTRESYFCVKVCCEHTIKACIHIQELTQEKVFDYCQIINSEVMNDIEILNMLKKYFV
jgi:hypothetical protein